MIKEKYYKELVQELKKFNKEKKLKFFVYGSSLRKDKFGDIDIGVMGEVESKDIRDLKEKFENSTFPYFVEFINFNKVSDKFKENVFNNKVIWIEK